MNEQIERAVSQHPTAPGSGVHQHVTVTVVSGRTYNPVTALVIFLALISLPALPILFCCTLVLLPYIIPVVVIVGGIWAIYRRLEG